MMQSELHEAMYGDASRVAEMRVQAKGRIALRLLRRDLLESWAVPILTCIDRGSSALAASWRQRKVKG